MAAKSSFYGFLERSENVFGLSDAHLYSCQVTNYDVRRSRLTIAAFNGNSGDKIYIAFTSVQLFDGPFSWKSAKFDLADQDKAMHKLSKLHDRMQLLPAELRAVVARTTHLFKVKCLDHDYTVRILASNAQTMRKR